MSPRRGPSQLFNAGGAARRLRASPLLAFGPSEPGPALRRGALVAVPIGLALVVATAVAEAFGGSELSVGIVLTVSAALTFGLLTVQYALFTAAITGYVVIALLAFLCWPNPGDGRRGRRGSRRGPSPPEPTAR